MAAAALARSAPRSDALAKVIWEATERQSAFIACPIFEILFGGARGGGKTDGSLGDFLEHADAYGEHSIGIMFRRQRTELIETIERSKAIYGPLGWKYHEQDKMWRAPNGARLRFAYLERDADAEAYQGHSYTRVYVEEIGNFPSEKPILKLMATLRSGAGVPVGFRATGNPGGPGHGWVKARYIAPAPGGWKVIKDPETGLERVFIPSRVEDNQHIGQDYVARLKASGSKELVRAWLEGDWSVIEGAFFDCWSTERHVIRPFAIPTGWLRIRSIDWGFADPFSAGWWAIATDDTFVQDGRVLDLGDGQYSAGMAAPDPVGVGRLPVQIPRGAMVRYREWYGKTARNVGLRLTAEEVAAGILAKSAGEEYAYTVLDPNMYAQNGGPSFAERFIKAGVTGLRPGDNKRVPEKGAMGGWDQMRARLVGDLEGRPMIFTFSTCVDSIETIPALQHDPDKAEDLDTHQEDHAADEWRYACMSRPYIRTAKPPKPKPRELVYEVNAQGQIVGNMSVLEIVQERMRRKKSDGH
jgi:hypothetical protein